MKSKLINNSIIALILLITLFSSTNLTAQNKSKKQLKEEAKAEKEKQTATLVNSKEFVFNVNRVLPQNGGTIEVSGDGYFVKFHNDTIDSNLPFYGRGFNIGYGGDSGLVFKGKPQKFTIEKTKKSYIVKTEVKGERDYFSFLLSVYFNGSAYLSVNSNNRSSISYDGDIKAVEKK